MVENKGKLKYMVVVIALLAGIGLASANNELTVDDPDVHDGSAVVVNFTRTGGYQTFAYGVNVTGAQTDRGSNTAIRGQTSLNVPGSQEGSAVGSLAVTCGWYAHGNFRGVYGRSTPNSLSNWDATFTSDGLGGRFTAGPEDTLTLNSAGTYWVGGVYGEVEGDIDGTPTAGAVAGVIGIDKTTGTAQSYAGYFDGKVKVTDLPPGSATDEIVVADPDGVLRNSGTSMSALGADADWNDVSDPGNPPDDIDDSIYTHGKVGIGTTNPQADLHIQDTMADIRLTSDCGNPSTIYFYETCAGPQATIRWSPTFGALMLETGGAPVKHIYLGARDNVGIKDFDPDAELEITKNPGAVKDLLMVSSSAAADGDYLIVNDAGNVGIGTTSPARKLHVNDVMRLQPRSTAPSSPAEGDIYMDGTSHTLMLYDGTAWRVCCGGSKKVEKPHKDKQ